MVLIAPCYIFGPEIILPMDLMSDMKTAGVYGMFDPNWDLARICDNVSTLNCQIATATETLSAEYEKNPGGLKLLRHVGQIATSQRLQKYIDDFDATQQSEEYDLEGISTVPISLIVA